jgi:DNA-binding IscR family transcriptional regulator
MNWLNTHLETCNAIEDPEEMQKCHSEGHAKFEELAEECRIQECYDGLDAEFAPKFEACKEFDTVAQ